MNKLHVSVSLWLVIFLLALPSSARAQDPYPAPQPGLPAPQRLMPDALYPDNDPQIGVPYLWGLFPDGDGGFRWYVSLDGPVSFGLTGIVCADNGVVVWCPELYTLYYDPILGRNWYVTAPYTHCGLWYVYYAMLGGYIADIRQPNLYLLACVFLPLQRRG